MNYPTPAWMWIVLAATIGVLLAIDLFVHRGERASGKRFAIIWSVIWIAAGLAFNVLVWMVLGQQAGAEYLAAYAIEKSLSVDNLFVFLIIFQSLNLSKQNQQTVLMWGVLGALVFRALFIMLGVSALDRWDWIVYVFAVLLIVAAIHAVRKDPSVEKESGLVNWLSSHLPVTSHFDGSRFWIEQNGKRVATPLLIAVVAVELSDIMFAIDSIPAALAVTRDRFIVYSSNAFAILGLRALYLVLATTIAHMRYLHYGLAAVLAFAGVKMLLGDAFHIPPLISVAIVVFAIGVSVLLSIRARPREPGSIERRPAAAPSEHRPA
jgi:tellurite resistance protein TerC